MDTDRSLEIGPVEGFAEQPPEFAVEADIGVGLDEARDVGQVAAEGKTRFTSAPIPSTRRRISARSEGMLKVP